MRKLIAGSPIRARVAGAVAGLLIAGAAMPAAASADLTFYFSGYMGAGVAGRQADVTRSQLTSSAVNSNCGGCTIEAGAHYSGGTTLYANWAVGTGEACHNYGTSNIGAMIEAPYTAQDIFGAVCGWVGSGGGSYC